MKNCLRILRVWRLPLLASLTALSSAGFAAEPILVHDFTAEVDPNVSSFPEPLLAVGDKLFFGAEDPLHGRELWMSTGPNDGARLVADLCPGVCGSEPRSFLALGSSLVFLATDADHGFVLWRTDGTRAGTTLVFEGAPGSGGLGNLRAWVVRGRLVIFANELFRGSSLWSSDGTRAGTRRYFTFPFLGEPMVTSEPSVTPGERLYFPMRTNQTGEELWTTDGTAAGTYSLGDLAPGSTGGYCSVGVAVASGRVEFSAQSNAGDCELWTTDGSAEGTHLVVDLAPEGASAPDAFVRLGARTFFRASTVGRGTELWVSDGTAAGTLPLDDLVPGDGSSLPTPFGEAGGRLIFTVRQGFQAVPYSTDGTAGSLRALVPGLRGSVRPVGWQQGEDLLFESSEVVGSTLRVSLWRTRGTPETTTRMAEFAVQQLTEHRVAVWGDRVAFGADFDDGAGDELAVTLPSGGSARVADLYQGPRGSLPRDLTAFARRMFFTAADEATRSRLFRSAGTSETTVSLDPLGDNEFGLYPSGLTAIRNGVIFTELTEGVGRAGRTSTATEQILDGKPPRLVWETVRVGPRAVINTFDGAAAPETTGALRLFATDGGVAGTTLVATLDDTTRFGSAHAAVRPEGDAAYWFTRVLIPSGDLTLGALWLSDGTVAGTRKLVDRPCGDCGVPIDWVAARGGSFYFVVNRPGPNSFDLWTSNGTAAGTRRLAQNGPATSRLTGAFLTAFDSPRGPLVIWTGYDATTGEEPWISDGTLEGTHRLKDLRGGRYGSRPREYTVIGHRIFFSADDGRVGRELWVSDGTPQGTRRFADLLPGRRGSRIHNLTKIDLGDNAGVRLVFSADDGVTGFEPWISDGTLAGTRRLADLNPGPDGSNPSEFTRLGKDLWMSAARPATGYELWRIALGF